MKNKDQERPPAEDDKISTFRRLVMRWAARGLRDLPWRRRYSPYRVLIAEMMLQQTQVDRVKGYFTRWMRRFPTLRQLAKAPFDEVLKHWEWLGYYRRARSLHEIARIVVDQHGGRIPNSVEALVKLPGIGRYTAGAIVSIGHDRRAPAVDGNVARVLARVFLVRGVVGTQAMQTRLGRLAERLVDGPKPRIFNQALMELGSTTCTPRRPLCHRCPLAAICRAEHLAIQEKVPRTKQARRRERVEVGVAILSRNGRYLVQRRPERGLLAGLWEFPGGKVEPNETPSTALQRELREELGIEVKVGPKIALVRHAYSHYKVALHVHRCEIIDGRPKPLYASAVRWLRPADFARYAFPAADARIFEILQDQTKRHPARREAKSSHLNSPRQRRRPPARQ